MDNTMIVEILLVEDNPRDAEMMIRALRKQNIRNPIHLVEDGPAALDFVFCRGECITRNILQQPKVILLDLKLPKISGLEVLKTIKTDERTRNIPVVIITSSKEDPDIKAAYAIGANSYVVKPMISDMFIDTMSKLGLYWLLVNEPPR